MIDIIRIKDADAVMRREGNPDEVREELVAEVERLALRGLEAERLAAAANEVVYCTSSVPAEINRRMGVLCAALASWEALLKEEEGNGQPATGSRSALGRTQI